MVLTTLNGEFMRFTDRLSVFVMPARGRPSKRMLPESGVMRPMTCLSRTLLPSPLFPMMVVT